MDLGVKCRTYEQLYNDVLNNCSSISPPQICPTVEHPTNSTQLPCNHSNDGERMRALASNTAVLEAVIGVLLAVIAVMAIGWVCTCVVMKRQFPAALSKNRWGGLHGNNSYWLTHAISYLTLFYCS